MAKDLPYFKFFVSEWNDGDITLEDYNIQGLFINVCSYYWSNECVVSNTKLHKKFKTNLKNIDYLKQEGFIKVVDDCISISFLDEQFEERETTSKKNSAAGKASAEARRLKKLEQQSNTNSTPVEITLNGKSTIKRREEKKREDTPTLEHFLTYCVENIATDRSEYLAKKQSAILKYKSWEVDDWHKTISGKRTKIKNWKTTILNTWKYL